MAKKNKLNSGEQLVANEALGNASLSDSKTAAPVSAPKNTKKSKKKSDKPNIFKRIGKFFKEMFSELKKVSWPGPKKVFAQLGTVLLVVVIFMVIVVGIDVGVGALLRLLVA